MLEPRHVMRAALYPMRSHRLAPDPPGLPVELTCAAAPSRREVLAIARADLRKRAQHAVCLRRAS